MAGLGRRRAVAESGSSSYFYYRRGGGVPINRLVSKGHKAHSRSNPTHRTLETRRVGPRAEYAVRCEFRKPLKRQRGTMFRYNHCQEDARTGSIFCERHNNKFCMDVTAQTVEKIKESNARRGRIDKTLHARARSLPPASADGRGATHAGKTGPLHTVTASRHSGTLPAKPTSSKNTTSANAPQDVAATGARTGPRLSAVERQAELVATKLGVAVPEKAESGRSYPPGNLDGHTPR